MSEERFDELKGRLAEIHDLRRTMELLFWDQTVMMPPPGRSADDARPDRP
jgi:Zn-dependent M32 family carboxypeptidase